jgi:hypothetical protein
MISLSRCAEIETSLYRLSVLSGAVKGKCSGEEVFPQFSVVFLAFSEKRYPPRWRERREAFDKGRKTCENAACHASLMSSRGSAWEGRCDLP